MDSAWMARAACRGAPTAMFFPERGKDVAPAYAICDRCPVRDECYRYVIDGDPDDVTQAWRLHGIWGRTSGMDRRAIWSRRRRLARETA